MSDRFFMAVVGGAGVLMGAAIAAPSLPLPWVRALALVVTAVGVGAIIYDESAEVSV